MSTYSKMRSAVDAELQPDEELLFFVFGHSDGDRTPVLLALTDRRVIAHLRGIFTRSILTWDYTQITAVGSANNLLGGGLVFTVPGDQFTCRGIDRTMSEEFRRLIDERLHEHRSRTGTTAAPSTSVADEIRKLAELRAMGALTDQEFESQKARLLE